MINIRHLQKRVCEARCAGLTHSFLENSIDLVDAELIWWPQFLAAEQGDRLLQTLQTQIQWRQDAIRLFGKTVLQPRLQAWYGDPEAVYTYSRLRLEPQPWIPALLELKTAVEAAIGATLGATLGATSGTTFNSVLLNLYRNGQDSMGWHSDDEPELGPKPIIASISLGETRPLQLRHKHQSLRHSIALTHGSLLVMQGETQQFWQHQIPKTNRSIDPRLNLTFRRIVPT